MVTHRLIVSILALVALICGCQAPTVSPDALATQPEGSPEAIDTGAHRFGGPSPFGPQFTLAPGDAGEVVGMCDGSPCWRGLQGQAVVTATAPIIIADASVQLSADGASGGILIGANGTGKARWYTGGAFGNPTTTPPLTCTYTGSSSPFSNPTCGLAREDAGSGGVLTWYADAAVWRAPTGGITSVTGTAPIACSGSPTATCSILGTDVNSSGYVSSAQNGTFTFSGASGMESVASTLTGAGFQQVAQTSDTAASNLTIAAQSAFASATTNTTGANLVLKAGSPTTSTNGSAGNVVAYTYAPYTAGTGIGGMLELNFGGSNVVAMGPYQFSGYMTLYDAIYLGAAAAAPALTNYSILGKSDGTLTYLNSPSATGAMTFRMASTTEVARIDGSTSTFGTTYGLSVGSITPSVGGASSAIGISGGVIPGSNPSQVVLQDIGGAFEVTLPGTTTQSLVVNPTSWAWSSGVASPGILQPASSTLNTPSSITVTPQPPSGLSGTAAQNTPGSVITALGTPGSVGTAGGEAYSTVTRSGTAIFKVGALSGAPTYGTIWLGNMATNPTSTNYSLFGDSSGTVTALNAPSTLSIRVGNVTGAQFTSGEHDIGTNTAIGTTSAGTFGGATNSLNLINGTLPSTAPVGGILTHDSLGLHSSETNGTSVADVIISPVLQGATNTGQALKVRKYLGQAQTTAASAVAALTIPLATSSTTGDIWARAVGRLHGSTTSFAQTYECLYENVAGTLAAATTTGISVAKSYDTAYSAAAVTCTISGTNVLVNVTGIAATTIDWTVTADVVVN